MFYLPNYILLNKKSQILTDHLETSTETNVDLVMTLLHEVQNLGFTFSPDLIECLLNTNRNSIIELHSTILTILKEMVGDNAYHKIMYPNFPNQVMTTSEAELYLNAALHYITTFMYDITNGYIESWLPYYEKEIRPLLNQFTKFKVLDIGNIDDFYDIFINIASSNTSISNFDKWILEQFLTKESKEFFLENLPEKIPHKETLSLIAGRMIERGFSWLMPKLGTNFSSANDILRIACVMSNGDSSLANPTKFRNFKRQERRVLLQELDELKSPNILEDMDKYRNRWIRLGEKLNPGDYRNKFPYALDYFTRLRENNKIEKFNGRLERAFQRNRLADILQLMKERPGVVIRQLDRILRQFGTSVGLTRYIENALSSVSTPVLIQLYGHFKSRNKSNNYRLFFPKSQLSKSWVRENNLEPLDSDIVVTMLETIENILEDRFREQGQLEGSNVCIDPELDNYTVPLSMRNQLDGLNVIPRGSKFYFSENYLRFFIHWKNTDTERVDLDLSCTFLDKDFNYFNHCSYTNLKLRDKKNEYLAIHSGDITNSPYGASEFIDLDRKQLLSNNIRYVMVNVFSFTKVPFYKIPECFFGWMERNDVHSGEVYEPKTVKNKINLTSDTQVSLPCIIDLQENKIIWVDMSYNNQGKCKLNNVEQTVDMMSVFCESMINKEYMTMYELLKLHVGKECYIKEEADIVFDIDNIDWNSVQSEYMK